MMNTEQNQGNGLNWQSTPHQPVDIHQTQQAQNHMTNGVNYPPNNNETMNNNTKKGLSKGVVIGIAVGIGLFFLICCIVSIIIGSAVYNQLEFDEQGNLVYPPPTSSTVIETDDGYEDIMTLPADVEDLESGGESEGRVSLLPQLPSRVEGVAVFAERGDRLVSEETWFEYAFNPNGSFVLYLDSTTRDDNFITGDWSAFLVLYEELDDWSRSRMPMLDGVDSDQEFYSVLFSGVTHTIGGTNFTTDWSLLGYIAEINDATWILWDSTEQIVYEMVVPVSETIVN